MKRPRFAWAFLLVCVGIPVPRLIIRLSSTLFRMCNLYRLELAIFKIMNDFSLLVRKKCEALDSEQKQIFEEEYNRRKNPFGDNCNSDLAMDILRDISLTFGNGNSIQENKERSRESLPSIKTDVSGTVKTPNQKSNGMLRFNIIFFFILGFVGLTICTKPSKIKMENDILNKYLQTQPKIVQFFKNMFIGEYTTEDGAENVVYNVFRENGKDILIDELDFVFVKKLKIKDKISNKNLVEAYGFWGMTLIDLNLDNAEIDINKNDSYSANSSNATSKKKRDDGQYKIIDNASNYKDYDIPVTEEKQESIIPNLLRRKGETLQDIKIEPKEDSIKI